MDGHSGTGYCGNVGVIWEALKNRRAYSTLDRNCRLQFRVNGAEMGSNVEEPVGNVEVYVRVSDPDRDDAISKIELFEDGKVVATDTPNKHARWWPVSRKPEPGRHYYFVKVTQADGNRLWYTAGVGEGGWGVAARTRPTDDAESTCLTDALLEPQTASASIKSTSKKEVP